MLRLTIVLFVLLYTGTNPAYGQIFGRGEPVDRGEPIFTPLKTFRERAPTSVPGVLFEKAKEKCAQCKLKGKLAPGAACKRCQAEKKREEEKLKEEQAKEAELKKLEAEAKKAELEAKKLQEEDKERNKPWDIADEENAELGDLLAAAAMAKKEQDLAPKKQQALDYLASLGCNKDPNVAKAILAGLQDYNTEVRKTAVQTVIYAMVGPNGFDYSVDPYRLDPYAAAFTTGLPCNCGQGSSCPRSCRGGCNKCARRAKCLPPVEPKDEDCPACDLAKQKELAKENRKKDRAMRRHKHQGGCQTCSAGDYGSGGPCGKCEIATEACASCQGNSSDGCKSCCAPDIRKELRKMAFDPDPQRKDCYYEPSIEVRNLALQAYNLCPDMADDAEEDPDVEPNQGSSESEAGTEESGTSEGNGDDFGPQLKESPIEDNRTGQSFDSLELGSSKTQMLRGHVSRFLNDGYEVAYSSQFQIPSGNQVYITGNGTEPHVAQVLFSSPGTATLKVVQGRFASRTSAVLIGVMR